MVLYGSAWLVSRSNFPKISKPLGRPVAFCERRVERLLRAMEPGKSWAPGRVFVSGYMIGPPIPFRNQPKRMSTKYHMMGSGCRFLFFEGGEMLHHVTPQYRCIIRIEFSCKLVRF